MSADALAAAQDDVKMGGETIADGSPCFDDDTVSAIRDYTSWLLKDADQHNPLTRLGMQQKSPLDYLSAGAPGLYQMLRKLMLGLPPVAYALCAKLTCACDARRAGPGARVAHRRSLPRRPAEPERPVAPVQPRLRGHGVALRAGVPAAARVTYAQMPTSVTCAGHPGDAAEAPVRPRASGPALHDTRRGLPAQGPQDHGPGPQRLPRLRARRRLEPRAPAGAACRSGAGVPGS
jgi:hypothetical protein